MRESQKERDGIIQVNSMLEDPVNGCVCVCDSAFVCVRGQACQIEAWEFVKGARVYF